MIAEAPELTIVELPDLDKEPTCECMLMGVIPCGKPALYIAVCRRCRTPAGLVCAEHSKMWTNPPHVIVYTMRCCGNSGSAAEASELVPL